MLRSPELMVKITFNLDEAEWHGRPSETLWASRLEQGNSYRLENTPFFVNGVSFQDCVGAKHNLSQNRLEFSGVVTERSGHSTFMILFDSDDSEIRDLWSRLELLGCTYESTKIDISLGEKVLYAVDGSCPRAWCKSCG